jgi:hypothetical protein
MGQLARPAAAEIGAPMKDMREQLERLRTQVAECELISQLATDQNKKELFARLARHHEALAAEIERAVSAASGK